MKRVAIVGAGALGITLAGLLAKDFHVTLFERNNKIGKKILASGNGRCNFTNVGEYKDKYNNEFANVIIKKFDSEYLLNYFESIGLAYLIDDENRAYPLSESSATVLELLKEKLKGVKVLTESRVTSLTKVDDKYLVKYNDKEDTFDYVVCASGGKASNLGSNDAYNYLSNLKLEMTGLTPSLCPIRVKENTRTISGVRSKALVSLYKNGKFLYKEKGEVLFKDNALSGIVIFNMSSYINRDKSSKYMIKLDLTSEARNKVGSNLKGIVNLKMLEYLEKNDIKDIRNLEFNVVGLDEFKNSQVVSGGVSLDEVNEDLSLKRYPRVYLGGELLDIDGVCGGYNLQFAFACAFTINKAIRGDNND